MNETKGQKVKAWFKKHWWVPVTVVVGTTTVIILRKKFGVDLKVNDLDLSDLKVDEVAKTASEIIDEDIFTDLAIKIEDAVLDPDVTHTILTKVYDLDFGSKVVTVEIGKQ